MIGSSWSIDAVPLHVPVRSQTSPLPPNQALELVGAPALLPEHGSNKCQLSLVLTDVLVRQFSGSTEQQRRTPGSNSLDRIAGFASQHRGSHCHPKPTGRNFWRGICFTVALPLHHFCDFCRISWEHISLKILQWHGAVSHSSS